MRILVISDGMWPPSVYLSGNKEIYDKLTQIARQGIEVHVLTFIERWANEDWKNWMEKKEKKYNINFHYLSPAETLKYIPSKILWKPLLIPKVLFLIKKYDFDLIHEFTSSPIWLRKGLIFRTFYRGPIIATIVTYLDGFLGSFEYSGKLKYLDKVVCMTKHQKKALNFDDSKTFFLPPCIDTSKYGGQPDTDYKDKIDVPLDCRVVLYLGPFEEHKGVFTLAEAIPRILKKNPKTIFIIAGDILAAPARKLSDLNYKKHNKNKEKILNLVGEYKKNVIFLEGGQDVPPLMSIADIITIPAKTHIGTLGYPLTLLEAMASGKAIAATDIIGINEVVNNENGLLVLPNDIEKLSDAISHLLEDDELRTKLSQKAREDSKKYDIEVISREQIKLYESLVASGEKS